MDKVLKEMKNKLNRKACFRTIISLVIDGFETQFEGIVNGEILHKKKEDLVLGMIQYLSQMAMKLVLQRWKRMLKIALATGG